jgi:hypothetical protein
MAVFTDLKQMPPEGEVGGEVEGHRGQPNQYVADLGLLDPDHR